MQNTVSIMGVAFTTRSLEQTIDTMLDRITGTAEAKAPLFHVITANPEIVMTAREDEHIRRILGQAGLVTPDGIGIVLASRWIGQPLQGRVTGFDILTGLLEKGLSQPFSVYLLGGEEETSREAAEVIRARYPGIKVAGRHHGFFGEEEEARILAEIEELRPDLLVVATGAPRAEKWIDRHRSRLRVKAAIGVGGSLDVLAGRVKRAPVLWQRMNLEWLYRLLSQPSRWRRQLVLPQFAWKVLTGKAK
ncbi:WecB/TagA/CpsF family glycosyltransferase [Paenibacillus filicis]|uniref:N-acetylglucosaminyldiphosphoundecaprenol N-acetyl-beta-D-mannosaminyltransferase n=1 Tax=Paenibacillus gyeongsangnamensis TaxID=3388067 RepID=A0ABT4QFS1_9BACL|nr:WecB/TagA/CpsF family glycosyltransferase [Paenibacillus filicis]MCZ8515711.1 WecB/TagA/CpsF family glycosyltransferase [Paenibacillus filicis]